MAPAPIPIWPMLLLALPLASAQQGIVKDWFTVLKGYAATTPGMGHQQAARLFAGLALSMDHALRCTRQQQGEQGGAAQDAAAAFGAHCYLNLAFPTQYLAHDVRLAQQLSNATDALRAAGRACGEAAAVKVFGSRVGDGMARYAQFRLPAPADGVYRFTPGMAALTLPGLGDVAPYLIGAKQCARITEDYVARLRGTGRHAAQGPYFGSQRYLDDLTEVSRLGCNASSARTAEQALTASFWNDGAGTSTAIGHFFSIALQVIPPHFSTSQQVRFFAVLFTALSDVSIPCFKVKYTANLWRPWTAISSPSAPAAVRDPTWVPALAQPGHPSYPSGHSCLSGAATKALELLTGSDATRVTVTSEGVPDAPGRVFTRFSDIAREAGRSRVYGGLHFAHDCHAGMALGQEVALAVWSKMGGWCGAK